MNEYTLEDVTFTNHILERFVERTMNKTGNELKQYLAQNDKFVKEKLLLLYNSADLLWSGKIKDHNFTHFYINKDGWIIVVDKEGKKIELNQVPINPILRISDSLFSILPTNFIYLSS